MTTTSPSALDRLHRQQPEWRPWLAVVEEILHDVSARVWEEAVEATSVAARPGMPLLASATPSGVPSAAGRLLERLVRAARRHGTPRMATLAAVLDAPLDVARLFRAALHDDGDYARYLAREAGADEEAFAAVAALLPVPFLQACNRRWAAAIQPGWVEGYCPVCGAWPAFVEVRGIERTRCFRCGRCGSEWHARLLRCPYCDLDDHHRLVSLTPENGGHRAIEACSECLGYVKTFTTLEGCPPDAVMVEDLASVDLDLAALDLGYMRPKGAGYARVTSG